MEVIKFTDANKQQYVDFVTAHPSGSFLQSWSWGQFQHSLGKPVARYGIIEDDEVVGTVQLLQTKVPHLPGYYLYIPYGPVLNNLSHASLLMERILHDFPDTWFIRIEPKQEINLSGSHTQRIQPAKTLVTDLTQSTEDLMSGMHPKTRYNIKVAAKHKVMVSHNKHISPEVTALLVATGKRQGYRNYPGSYYESMVESLAESNDCHAIVYQAFYNDTLVAAAVMLDHGNKRTYLFGGSEESSRNVMAPYALHWQAITDAKAAGLTQYDWWGIETASGKQPGFVQFKLRWGGEEIAYPSAIDLVQKSAWYTVYTVLRKLNRIF